MKKMQSLFFLKTTASLKIVSEYRKYLKRTKIHLIVVNVKQKKNQSKRK